NDREEVEIIDDITKEPNALERLEEIRNALKGKQAAIFLDYDGIPAQIDSHPDMATLDKAMKETLQALCDKYTVAIISGRDRPDVERHVGIEGIFYAGSHGFDIQGPGHLHFEIDEGRKRLPALEGAHIELQEAIQ